MKKLKDKEWNPYVLSEQFVNYHGKRLTKSERVSGSVPMLTAGKANNGVADFISNINMSKYRDVVTVDMFGNSFFHPYTVTGDDNIYFFENHSMQNETKLFIASSINKQSGKFDYGKQFRQPDADKLKILMPSDSRSKPDHKYMSEYISYNRKRLIARYKDFAEKQISKIEYKKILDINKKQWNPFPIVEMFEPIRGHEGNMAMLDEGNVPLISAKNTNNGLKGFVKTLNKQISGNCISLNNDGDGGAGLAYYQPSDMALDTHVTALIPKRKLNKFTLLFIANCLSGLHEFFGHGLSISTKRVSKIKIMLPVNENNEPDFEYMEQYAKNIIIKKYNQYLKYLENNNINKY